MCEDIINIKQLKEILRSTGIPYKLLKRDTANYTTIRENIPIKTPKGFDNLFSSYYFGRSMMAYLYLAQQPLTRKQRIIKFWLDIHKEIMKDMKILLEVCYE